jgi:predicted porin
MNKFKFLFASSLLLISMSAISAPKVYGKLNIALNNDGSDGVNEKEIDLVSNSSRLGLKGELEMQDGLVGLYQIEYQIDPVDGHARDEVKGENGEIEVTDSTFTQRNSYVGLKGSFGTLKLGKHDTPLKKASLKVDLFNDLKGDIKNITDGENRITSFLGYDSPVFGGGVSISVSLSKGKDDGVIGTDLDGEFGTNLSASLKYDIEVIQFVIATEKASIKGFDHNRLGMMIPAGPVTIGLMHTTTESTIGNSVDYDATTISIAGKVADGNGRVKFQYGTSDKSAGLTQTQIGYDHKLFKNFKILAYHTVRSQDAANSDDAHTGLGIEYKF